MIFTNGAKKFVVSLSTILKEVYSMYGLQLNSSKSEIFSTNVNSHVLSDIQQETGFKFGTMHVRYLGVPFVFGVLTIKVCDPLIRNWLKELIVGLLKDYPMLIVYN